jgi:hypothetical protein
MFNTTLLHNIYIKCLLFLHVSAMNFSHLQEAASSFHVYRVYGNLDISKWQTIYIHGKSYLEYLLKSNSVH